MKNTKRRLSLAVALLCLVPSPITAQWSRVLTMNQVMTIEAENQMLLIGGPGGLQLSTNNGNTWMNIAGNLTGEFIYDAEISDNMIYVATLSSGLYTATLGAVSWQSIDSALLKAASVRAIVELESALAVATENGVFFSTTGGTQWHSANEGLGNIAGWTLVIGDNLLLGGYSGLMSNEHPDSSWIAVNESLMFFGLNQDGNVAATATGVFRSTGNVWQQVSSAFRDSAVLAITSEGMRTAVGSFGAVHLSADEGATFANVTANLPSEPVLALAIVGDSLYAGTASGLFVRAITPATVAWSTPDPNRVFIVPNPFHQTLVVQVELEHASEVKVSLMDMLGRILLQSSPNRLDRGTHTIELEDLEPLPSGAYLLMVKTSEEKWVLPVQKIR